MAGSANKLTEWQRKKKRQIETLLVQREFQAKVAEIRAQSQAADNIGAEASLILVRNNLPSDCILFLAHYIRTGEKNWELIPSPIRILSHRTRTLLPSEHPTMMYAMYMRTIDSSEETQSQLIIADSATKEEVLNFIETNWSSIKPHATSRVRGRPYADRDDEIYELAKTLSAREIQSKFAGRGFDLSEPHIRKIIERERKRRDT